MYLRAFPKRQEAACDELPGDRDPTSHCAHFVCPLEHGRLWCTSLQRPTRCLLIALCNQRLVRSLCSDTALSSSSGHPGRPLCRQRHEGRSSTAGSSAPVPGGSLELLEGPQRVFYCVVIGKGSIKYSLNPHSLGKRPGPRGLGS